MKFFKTKIGVISTVAVVIGLVFLTLVLSWSHTRFTRISACVTCHEIFVDYDEYKPVGKLSESLEDYNPSKEIDPGYFKVTVGCAECHAYPFEEYRESPHYDNERGVQPGCLGCHNAHSVRQIFAWKFFYVNKGSLGESPFHAISNSLRDIPEWEDLRVELAGRVRKQMVEENSEKCIVCHKPESKWFNKTESHQKSKKTCIQCHYNLVHKGVKWPEAALDSKAEGKDTKG